MASEMARELIGTKTYNLLQSLRASWVQKTARLLLSTSRYRTVEISVSLPYHTYNCSFSGGRSCPNLASHQTSEESQNGTGMGRAAGTGVGVVPERGQQAIIRTVGTVSSLFYHEYNR